MASFVLKPPHLCGGRQIYKRTHV